MKKGYFSRLILLTAALTLVTACGKYETENERSERLRQQAAPPVLNPRDFPDVDPRELPADSRDQRDPREMPADPRDQRDPRDLPSGPPGDNDDDRAPVITEEPTRPREQAPAPQPAPVVPKREEKPAPQPAPAAPKREERPEPQPAPRIEEKPAPRPAPAAPQKEEKPPAPAPQPAPAAPKREEKPEPAPVPAAPKKEEKPAPQPAPPAPKREERPAALAPDRKEQKAETRQEAPSDAGPTLSRDEIEESGTVIPTVYYFATVNEDERPCDSQDKRALHGPKGEVLMRVCSRTLETCALQGSCTIVKDDEEVAVNILKRVNGQERFFKIDENGCRFGFGVSSSCLDPFYTLAADLSIYKPGDVIYVPAVAGLRLPNGKKHHGYFVIRDRGRKIIGRGRFDFFSGTMSYRDQQNPFAKIGLADKRTNVPYYKIKGPRADRIRKEREFPKLPAEWRD